MLGSCWMLDVSCNVRISLDVGQPMWRQFLFDVGSLTWYQFLLGVSLTLSHRFLLGVGYLTWRQVLVGCWVSYNIRFWLDPIYITPVLRGSIPLGVRSRFPLPPICSRTTTFQAPEGAWNVVVLLHFRPPSSHVVPPLHSCLIICETETKSGNWPQYLSIYGNV